MSYGLNFGWGTYRGLYGVLGRTYAIFQDLEALLFQCHRPYSFNEILKCEWHTKFFALDQKLCKVLALLGHAPVNHVPSLLS